MTAAVSNGGAHSQTSQAGPTAARTDERAPEASTTVVEAEETEDSEDDYEEPQQPAMIAGSLDDVRFSTHALVPPLITRLRDERTTAAGFREAVKLATRIIAIEATADLPLRPRLGLRSPVAPFDGFQLGVKICLLPILRAGSEMLDPLLELIPEASVRHIGLFGKEMSLLPTKSVNKRPLPNKLDCDLAFILDPIIASGSAASRAVLICQESGLKLAQIRVVTLIASSPGLSKLLAECPGLIVHCGAADEQLNADGQIVPGVGAAGDRLFST